MMNIKIIVAELVAIFCSGTFIQAQVPVNVNLKGEKSITLYGREFPISLDDISRTAKIEGDKSFKIDAPLSIFGGIHQRILRKPDKGKTLVIPSTVKIGNTEYTVTVLGRGVFASFRNIHSVEIPNTITTIEDEAFFYTSIKSVVIPSSMEYIGNRAFERSEVKSVVIPSSVEHIGARAFAKSSLREVTIPAEVEFLGDSAFYDSDLRVVEMQGAIDHTGKDVFKDCKDISKIILPNPNIPVDNLFVKSENIAVEYREYGTSVAVATPKKKKKKVEKKEAPVVFATSSDVDVNIPTSARDNDETFAIIIANEDYEKVQKVDCAHNDGRTFLKYCQSTLGIPDTNIRYVEDATLGNMMEVVNWVSNVAKVFKEDARIIVYYAGHGIPNETNGAAYLLPVDVAGNNIAGAYKLSSLYETLGSLQAKNVTVFIDACFSGSKRGNGMLASSRGVAIRAKKENPLGNMVVFSAAKDDETAYPYAEKGHGLFTYYLLKKMQETNGNVDYETLGNYINKEVSRRAIVVNNKPQTPTVFSSPHLGEGWRNIKLR